MPRRQTADERLRTYRAKRDFSITAEPEGTTPPAADGWRFVVQRHRARALHYDVRLEAGGVLVSWAVPKGPTLDPAARRLAVHVEDHPLDYYDFEGVIAAGEYGGGDVIVWDWGTWTLVEGDDPLDEIAAGDLHLALDGDKLRGRFALVRRGRDKGAREQWLMIKKRDDDAVDGWDPEEHPRSVKSGRTNDEVRDAPAASWTGTASWAAATEDELAALDALGASGTWSVGGHDVRLTGLDDVRIPARGRGRRGVTKRDLVRHNAALAPALLPYLDQRPLELVRFPSGADGKTVHPRTVPRRATTWLRRDSDGDIERFVPDSAAALAWLANWDVLELRPATTTVGDPDHPTWAHLHIDAGRDGDMSAVVELARLHRTALEHLGIDGRPVLIGGRSIQIWVPIAPRHHQDRVHEWVMAVAGAIGTTAPELVADGARLGAPDQTPVAPFSVGAAPGAPVAVPLSWHELDDDEALDGWTIRDAGERLRSAGDPLAPLIGQAQRLPAL